MKVCVDKLHYDLFCSLMSQRIDDMKRYYVGFQTSFNKSFDSCEDEEV